jgi:hypothetical protein
MKKSAPHYRPWFGDVTTEGYTLYGVVSDHEGFMSPRATHDMYVNFEDLPPFATVRSQASERLDRFFLAGYHPVAGILTLGQMSVSVALKQHEKAALYLSEEYLVGPYFMDNQLMQGVKIYRPSAARDIN